MSKNVIRDPEFGYLRLDPVPSQADVEKHYAEEFYAANATRFNNSALSVQHEQVEFLNSRWENIYQTCEKFFSGSIENKTAFDIGFGFAKALMYLRDKGFTVSGIEPSPEGIEYARSHGITAYQTGIENFEVVGQKRFDVVLLLNVLEHLRQPADTLTNIRTKLLQSTGLLVIDVPNDFNLFQQVANAEYELDEWWVVAPTHINYFSPKTLNLLLKSCGYRIVDYEASFPLDMFLLFGDQYVGDQALGRQCHDKRVNFESLMRKHGKQSELKTLYKAFADLDLGRSFSVYATPVD